MTHLRKLIGPWMALFRGKSTSPAMIKKEENLYKKIKQFVKGKKYTNRQITLIFLLLRGHTLQREHLPKAIDAIVSVDDVHIDVDVLYDFLVESNEIFSKTESATDNYFPCLLIVDELLDCIPWEMLIPEQETTRFHSFGGLYKLFRRYQADIRNGYFYKRLEVGNVLLNPDASLPQMEKRMKALFQYWVPKFNLFCGQQWTNDESIELLSRCDLYFYAGHGSGVQFFKAEKVMALDMSAIVFLMGCSSVGLSASGGNAMHLGVHHYYHLANCPTVVGMIHTVSDFECDLVSAKILTKFIPTTARCDWDNINRKAWRDGNVGEWSSILILITIFVIKNKNIIFSFLILIFSLHILRVA